MTTTIDRVQRVVANHLGKDIEDVPATAVIGDLVDDSLDRIEIEMALEDEFDIHFESSESIDPTKNVGDLATRVDAMREAASA